MHNIRWVQSETADEILWVSGTREHMDTSNFGKKAYTTPLPNVNSFPNLFIVIPVYFMYKNTYFVLFITL